MSISIHDEILELKKEAVELRRDFHQYPELGFKEKRTSKQLADYLGALGLRVQTEIAETGVVGFLSGRSPGPTLLIRADMDALPIEERTEKPYKSKNAGVMHACGHDGHMAAVMITAKALARRKEKFSGQIKFVFQPGEEGFAGAREMIRKGVLIDPKVDSAIGFHLYNSMPLGSVLFRSGPTMASMDSFVIKVIGKGGHAAMPDEAVDAILVSAHVVTSLQSLISREVSPLDPLVVHIGTIHGGSAFNIVSDIVELKGTVRTLNADLQKSMPERMRRVITNTTAAFKGAAKFDYDFGYPPLVNDAMMVDLVRNAARDVVKDGGILATQPLMASDDMAFFLREVPGCFFFVGSANQEKGLNSPHHNSLYDFDEDAMLIAAEILVKAALSFFDKTELR